MSIISSFKSIENKHDVYRRKDCMKKFCEYLTEHAVKIINSKKKKMKLLTNKWQKSSENASIYCTCKQTFKDKRAKDKKCCNVGDSCHCIGEYRSASHSACNLKYSPGT